MDKVQLELRKVWLLLTPSWLSGSIAVSVGFLLEGLMIILSIYDNSRLKQEFFPVHQATSNLSTTYQDIANKVSGISYVNSLPLFIFWIGIGIIVYFLAFRVVQMLTRAYDFEMELNYVHVDRKKLLGEAALHVVIRLIALIAFLVLIAVFLHRVLPYVIITSHNFAKDITLSGAITISLATLAVIANICLLTVCLRLIFLRRRLLSTQL